MPFLNELYARYAEADFKTKFQSIVHHPLTEIEFEAAWKMLIDESTCMKMALLENYMKCVRNGFLFFSNMTIVGLWCLRNVARA